MDSNLAAVIISAFSLFVAALSLFAVVWQARQAAHANELNSFITLRTFADRLNYSKGIDVISRQRYENYPDFEARTTPEEREYVRTCIEFLNLSSHLVEGRFVERQKVWNIYFMAYRIVGANLLPW